MKAKAAFVVGAGIGYVLGTRAGRQQFEKIKGWADDAWHDPRVQAAVGDVEERAAQFAKEQGAALKDRAVDAVKSRVGGGSDADPADGGAPYSAPTPDGPYPEDGPARPYAAPA
ncbi:YtxH domain-containing protein [Cellulomonas hominis]